MEWSGVVLSADAADMQIQANSSEKGVSNGRIVQCEMSLNRGSDSNTG
jgi:hypothetical protein